MLTKTIGYFPNVQKGDFNMVKLLISGEKGSLYSYDFGKDELEKVFQADSKDTLMGLGRDKEFIYVGGSAS